MEFRAFTARRDDGVLLGHRLQFGGHSLGYHDNEPASILTLGSTVLEDRDP